MDNEKQWSAGNGLVESLLPWLSNSKFGYKEKASSKVFAQRSSIIGIAHGLAYTNIN